MAQRDWELKLESRKRELKVVIVVKVVKVVIAAQNEPELAQVEHEMIAQEVTERNAEKSQDNKVSETITSLKHYFVPSPNVNIDAENKDNF